MTSRLAQSTQYSLLALLFNNVAFANVGLAAGILPTATVGVLYISLHNADPGAGGTMSTNETTYTNYARQTLPRSAAGWQVNNVTPASAWNAAAITFPQCGVSSDTLSWFSVGLASGASVPLFQGTLATSFTITSGVVPSFPIGSCICVLD